MKTNKYISSILLCLMLILAMACGQSQDSRSEPFSQMAIKGKQVFEENECGKCHYVGEREAAAEMAAPDLTHAFLANDSMFVQVHLKFVERSEMPPIALTEEEIHQVSRYIGELHAAKYPTVPLDQADAMCPVCYAPVSTEQAKQSKLEAKFLGNKYYFECEECLQTFRAAPEAYVELLRQYENYGADSLSFK